MIELDFQEEPCLLPLSFGSETVHVAYLRTLLDVVGQHGVPGAELLRDLGVEPEVLASASGRVCIRRAEALFRLARSHTGNHHIGLSFGMAVQPWTFSGVGQLVMTCRNLGEALLLLVNYGCLVIDSQRTYPHIDIQADQCVYTNQIHANVAPLAEEMVEGLLISLLRFSKWITGTGPDDQVSIHFRHPEIDGAAARYTQELGCRVQFGMPSDCLIFPTQRLSLPLRAANPMFFDALLVEVNRQMDAAFSNCSLARRVREVISERMSGGKVTIETVADRLGMNIRGLQRGLTEEGTSFRQVHDELRRQQAAMLVRQGRFSLLEIASLLGYAHQSAFNHAFRSWFGCSPQHYRAAQPEGEVPSTSIALQT